MRKVLSNNTLWVFLLCSLVVIFTQFLILQPILKYSLLTRDDWMWLLNFRSLLDLNFFEKLAFIWMKIGIHEGAYAVYMGILGELFHNNYSAYQCFNITLKIISTLTLFPVILILFRNKLLAFLTTVIYGINSASTGSFYWYMKGGIFPAIALMNLFFISYYFTLLKNSRILLLLSSVLILLSYLFSPTRIFPIFLIVSGIEIYWLLKYKSKAGIRNFLIRLICLLLPSILIAMQAPVSPNGRVVEMPLILLNQILSGNWFNLLSPLQGIGYSLLTVENMRIFGSIDFSTFKNLENYIMFLFNGSVWIFLFSLIFLAILITKKILRFILFAFILNFLLDILMFYLAGHHFFIPPMQVQEMSPSLFVVTKYPTLAAIFILVIAFMTFLEWLEEKKNYLLLAVSIGPLFSLIFLSLMWVTIGYLLDGYNSVHYYYQIPAIGVSLFLAAILVLFYEKFKKRSFQTLSLLLISGVILGFYISSSIAINREFLGIYPERVEVKNQQILHERLMKKLGNFNEEDNILVYFELPQDLSSSKYYERSLFLNTEMFGDFVFLHKEGNKPHCVGHISSMESLQSSISFMSGKWGFILSGRCLQKSIDQVFYSIESLHAYKIDKGEFIDIKVNLLKELNFQ